VPGVTCKLVRAVGAGGVREARDRGEFEGVGGGDSPGVGGDAGAIQEAGVEVDPVVQDVAGGGSDGAVAGTIFGE